MTWFRFLLALVAVTPLLWMLVALGYGVLLPKGLALAVLMHVNVKYGSARFDRETNKFCEDLVQLAPDLQLRHAPRYTAIAIAVVAKAPAVHFILAALTWPWWAPPRMMAVRLCIARLNKRLPAAKE